MARSQSFTIRMDTDTNIEGMRRNMNERKLIEIRTEEDGIESAVIVEETKPGTFVLVTV